LGRLKPREDSAKEPLAILRAEFFRVANPKVAEGRSFRNGTDIKVKGSREVSLHSHEFDTSSSADPFADMEVPEALQASLQRHRENLARLIRDLQSAGISEEQIETSVSVIVASYRDELLRAVKSMMR
jgi:hypothetical protein